jgi:NAD(P)H-flavin reductase
MMATATIATEPMTPVPHLVHEVVKETPDTFTLTLQPEDGARENSFLPGQFSMLWVFGVGELPISISGDPGKEDRLVYTVRSVGKATNALVSQNAGAGVGVRGPFGTGWYRRHAATI